MEKIYKIVTCGDVDSGKSTLLGRILYNTGNIYDDQIEDIISASKKYSSDNRFEYGFLFDGLKSEREQQITIDIAHRFFNIKDIRFHLLDAPGHKQYTHNFVIGCLEADCAILMVDSTKGITEQTINHYNICKDLLVDDIIICVTKIDLVDSIKISKLKNEIHKLFSSSKIFLTSAIDNIATDDLINYIYNLALNKEDNEDFVFEIQSVIHAGKKRILHGIEFGTQNKNLKIYPSEKSCSIEPEKNIPVTYKLNTNVDVGRGHIITNIELNKSHKLSGKFIKFDDNTHSSLLLKYGTSIHKVKILTDNSIELEDDIYFTSIDKSKRLGVGLLIDSKTKTNVGIFIITKSKLSPKCFWFTGLSGSGKTTLAKKLIDSYSIKPILLDGDEVRSGINSDLDLSIEGRNENIRRIAQMTKLLVEQGHIVIVSCISKELGQRKLAKEIIGGSYLEIYVESSNETREIRDTKGLYKSGINLLSDYQQSDYETITVNTDFKNEFESFEELKTKISEWKNI